MIITEIEFGFTKNIGNYENQRITYRAKLEAWENPSESLNLLRSKVAEEIDLPDKWHDLKNKFARQVNALEKIDSQIKAKKAELAKAEEAWGNFAEFLIGHGVDPATLTIENFRHTRTEYTQASDSEIEDDANYYLNDREDEDFDPYEYYPVDDDDEC